MTAGIENLYLLSPRADPEQTGISIHEEGFFTGVNGHEGRALLREGQGSQVILQLVNSSL